MCLQVYIQFKRKTITGAKRCRCGRCRFGFLMGDVGVLGDELTSRGMGCCYLELQTVSYLSISQLVSYVVLGVSVVSGTSPNFTFFQRQEVA